jgi:hypothetical protein
MVVVLIALVLIGVVGLAAGTGWAPDSRRDGRWYPGQR